LWIWPLAPSEIRPSIVENRSDEELIQRLSAAAVHGGAPRALHCKWWWYQMKFQ
jgi:hypothetical protein